MYLVQDTVEESFYDISVSRRLAHIVQREKEKEAQSPTSKRRNSTTVENITETAIDSANSLELQDATLAKLMTGGPAGGEMVLKDDLWQCLFGNSSLSGSPGHSLEAEREVGRFLRAEAAEERKNTSTFDTRVL
jgi:E3 ubiquitin-protein ligase SHPRH